MLIILDEVFEMGGLLALSKDVKAESNEQIPLLKFYHLFHHWSQQVLQRDLHLLCYVTLAEQHTPGLGLCV